MLQCNRLYPTHIPSRELDQTELCLSTEHTKPAIGHTTHSKPLHTSAHNTHTHTHTHMTRVILRQPVQPSVLIPPRCFSRAPLHAPPRSTAAAHGPSHTSLCQRQHCCADGLRTALTRSNADGARGRSSPGRSRPLGPRVMSSRSGSERRPSGATCPCAPRPRRGAPLACACAGQPAARGTS